MDGRQTDPPESGVTEQPAALDTAAEAAPGFDWAAVPLDAIPDDVLDALTRHPKVDARVNSIASKRAQGTIQQERERMRQMAEAAEAQRADAARQQRLLELAESDPLELAETVKKDITTSRAEREAQAQLERLRQQIDGEATARQLERITKAASLRVQARMNDMGLPSAEQDAIWTQIEQRTLTSPDDVIAITDQVLDHLHKRQVEVRVKNVEREAVAVKKQAATSARAAVAARTAFDAPPVGAPENARERFLRDLHRADDKTFDDMWRQIRSGAYPGV